MKKKIILIILITIIALGYVVPRKIYEHKLKESFYSYAINNGISKEKIRKTELNYFIKSNHYEYNIYIKDVDDDFYFNFSYPLPYDGRLKTYYKNQIDSSQFDKRVYFEGSIEDINTKKGTSLIIQAQ